MSFPLPLKTFSLFPSLPLEIRLKIWDYALPGPRVIEIDWQQPIGKWVCRCESQKKPSGLLGACKESRERYLRVGWSFLEVVGVVVGGEGEGDGEEEDEEDGSEILKVDDDGKREGEREEDLNEDGLIDGEQNRSEDSEDVENGTIENDASENEDEETAHQDVEDDQEDPEDDEEAREAGAAYWTENPGFDPETGEPYLPAPIPGSKTYINPLIDTLYICANRQSEISIRPQSMEALLAMPCLATLERLACEHGEVKFGWNDGEPPEAITSFLSGVKSVEVVVGDFCWNDEDDEGVERLEGEIELMEMGEEVDEYREAIEAASNLFIHPDRKTEVDCSTRRILRGEN